MISHPLPMDSPVNLKDMLWNDFKIEVPIFDWGKRNFIRVSAHFYNDQKDMDHLIKALKEIFNLALNKKNSFIFCLLFLIFSDSIYSQSISLYPKRVKKLKYMIPMI